MKKALIALTLLLTQMTGCSNAINEYTFNQVPEQDDGLRAGSMQSAGLDPALIGKAVKKIKEGKFGEVHSLLIYRDSLLVLEEYFRGHNYQWDAPGYHGELVDWNRDMAHPVMSCTKSITSACIAIAIEKGFIDSVTQSIFDYLPDHQELRSDNREYITIENLLTMTSGLEWDEWSTSNGTSANDIDMLYFACDDPVKCVLDNPWWAPPGQLFTYNGGGMVILGEILRNATGMGIDEFSAKYLFGPLNIESATWARYPNGMFDAAGSLSLTPRDMLKFGITYLDNGIWNGSVIIPAAWVEKSSHPYRKNRDIKIPIEDSGKNGYGYHGGL
ncbi:MAG: serine hydrolase [Bacteroidales bacterium]